MSVITVIIAIVPFSALGNLFMFSHFGPHIISMHQLEVRKQVLRASGTSPGATQLGDAVSQFFLTVKLVLLNLHPSLAGPAEAEKNPEEF